VTSLSLTGAPVTAACRPPAASRNAETARVMICDDSAVIRGALARILESDPEIAVVAKVENGKLALEQMRTANVDVVVLDIEMPVMDGLTALPLLLRADPGVRVIMASTLTTRGAEIALRALRLGASDYVPKPSTIGTVSDDNFKRELLEKVKGLAGIRHRATFPAAGTSTPGPPAGCGQFDRRPPGPIRAGSGPRAFGRCASRHYPAHAGDLHPYPGRPPKPLGLDALHGGA
jgi:two-component system, chemotaxis family, protein-glutamate methylesterase/glutaminase